nr:hypothetical protein [Streptomyces sp. YIM 130001]
MPATPPPHGPARTACPYCGWPDEEPAQTVVSEHRTGCGVTRWTRCWCGSLQVRQITADGTRVSARGRPAVSTRPERAQDVGSCRLGPS